ncbi:hypothetical protein KXD93_19085 [Mucilaginibacter sp. BJC16-A38]|uniref:hypothetical protein n=1 Tax=Mucilaginibacter phenanthrenivorans TaxID=1234842 RepID=UPI0021589045|nr:hypothetical protein [Mucilaginibacter phenanthrenivorans]MCR8559764.1 hypothetical protein [Mucilaginibacter phenanthrenivorans]
MDIKYLIKLRDNPTISWVSQNVTFDRTQMAMEEIETLEASYNHGDIFPAALRELLFLAGKHCYVLDYGIYDTQSEMQEAVRSWLPDHNKQISRRFFAIDVYNAYDQFVLIYLDEGVDDPQVYEAALYSKETIWIEALDYKLSEFIDKLIIRLLSGYNPF